MEQRLEELRKEYQNGLQQLALLDRRRQEVHRTLLRISGAIQVLEELLNQEVVESQNGEEADDPALRLVKTG